MVAHSELLARFARLTHKQLKVLHLVSENMTGKEIARELGVSPSSIEQHLRGVRNHFGPLSRRELSKLYREVEQALQPCPSVSHTSAPIEVKLRKLEDANHPPEAGAGTKASTRQTDPLQFTPSLRFAAGLIVGFVLGVVVT